MCCNFPLLKGIRSHFNNSIGKKMKPGIHSRRFAAALPLLVFQRLWVKLVRSGDSQEDRKNKAYALLTFAKNFSSAIETIMQATNDTIMYSSNKCLSWSMLVVIMFFIVYFMRM